MTEFDDKQIIQSWYINAKAWTDAIQNQEIESRNIVTNKAIVEAVMERRPSTVLDVGCGEGWLSRTLIERNVKVSGIDVVPELIENAKNLGAGTFYVCSYEKLAKEQIFEYKFDAVICNFSLIGKDDVEQLIRSIPNLLNRKGNFYIQTLYPLMCCRETEYEDGWRKGSWDGLGPQFKDPAPWYFRTIATWERLLSQSGFEIIERREPKFSESEKLASVIFICENTI